MSPSIGGCSAILDASATQCRTNADCARFGGNGRTFACVQNGCTLLNADAGVECQKNDDCIGRLGDFHICRKTDFKCVSLLTRDCPKMLGNENWRSDDAVILGSILPTIGRSNAAGVPLANAIELAIADFTQGARGLPPVGGRPNRRPIAVVSCSEESDVADDREAPERSAAHLTALGVPAIIGAAFSGDTLRVANVTIPSNVLLISPTATSVAITSLDDNGLVWRTAPSDAIQARALIGAMADVESMTRARWELRAEEHVRVWIMHKSDPYGRGLAEALERGLSMNGMSALAPGNADYFRRLDYGDPNSTDSPPTFAEKVAEVKAAVLADRPPHIVFLMGTSEVINDLMVNLEGTDGPAWKSLAKRPTYLLADGGVVDDLWEQINSFTDFERRESLRKRVLGSVPGTTNVNYNAFVSLYNSRFPDGTATVGGTAAAYDALYLLSFAIVVNGDRPLTGPNLAEGLRRMVKPGQTVAPSSTTINSAFQILASGANIDYDGASGPLEFDLTTGEAVSDIQLWCVPKDTVTGQALPTRSSGAFYDSLADQISGQLATGVATACP